MYSFISSEFDNWYAESFLNQADESTSVVAGHGVRPGIFIPYNPNAMVGCPYFGSNTPEICSNGKLVPSARWGGGGVSFAFYKVTRFDIL